MKCHIHIYAIALSILLLAYGFNWFENKLIEAVPLQEIEVKLRKLPEFSIDWRIALKRYPDIKQHGLAFRCVRDEMCREDI